jgi:hypothetical protein
VDRSDPPLRSTRRERASSNSSRARVRDRSQEQRSDRLSFLRSTHKLHCGRSEINCGRPEDAFGHKGSVRRSTVVGLSGLRISSTRSAPPAHVLSDPPATLFYAVGNYRRVMSDSI